MVKLYALSTCPYCRMTKQFLDEQGVEYDLTEVDKLEGEKREEALQQVREVSGGTSFPVLLVDGEVVVGYDKKRVKEVLDL